MEVSIWDENKEKDVYFDSKKTWVGTSWDVRASELPQAVIQVLMPGIPDLPSMMPNTYKTPVSEEWYIIELGKQKHRRGSGKPENKSRRYMD